MSRPVEKQARGLASSLRKLDEMNLFPDEGAMLISMQRIRIPLQRRMWRMYGLGFLGGLAVAVCAAALINMIGLRPAGDGLTGFGMIVFAVLFALFISRPLMLRRTRPILRDELLNRWNVPICLSCGYALWELSKETAMCPECGAKVSERAKELMSP